MNPEGRLLRPTMRGCEETLAAIEQAIAGPMD